MISENRELGFVMIVMIINQVIKNATLLNLINTLAKDVKFLAIIKQKINISGDDVGNILPTSLLKLDYLPEVVIV